MEQRYDTPAEGHSESAKASPPGDTKEDELRYDRELYTRRVHAGKRTYFVDAKSTRAGDDFYVTITERKRLDGGGQERFRVFLYKEDFGEFVRALHDVIGHIKDERLPGHDFDLLPPLPGADDDAAGNAAGSGNAAACSGHAAS